jgi:hypothetical protein
LPASDKSTSLLIIVPDSAGAFSACRTTITLEVEQDEKTPSKRSKEKEFRLKQRRLIIQQLFKM